MTARIATEQELRDLDKNMRLVITHYYDWLNVESRTMAVKSAQADRLNAARIYGAIARSL